MTASKRGHNWSVPEDEALCLAWLNTSQDSSVSANERGHSLYDRIHESFLEICAEKKLLRNPALRAATGIKARWHTISKNVSKFTECLAQIRNRHHRSISPEDAIKQAVALFATTEKAPFTLMHCHILLQNEPKWKQYHTVKGLNQKRAATEFVDTTRDSSESDDAGSASGSGRPIGQRAAKARKLVTRFEKHTDLQMTIAAQERAAYMKQKVRALTRMANHAIMSMNLEGLNETAREYYLLEQQRILNETRKQAKRN
ncbi:uncharacterized protein LOC129730194 [Wyeomyia smithii]|uniref:uncharacterized protein LOC129730194 n=1 Tax=Wyeomyia smithii TaxID=174621 RepID=UPI002467AFB6|nr:uncharacterized protein LOC129730194 [Wyeomyia smithii]